jgi:hypothetical protein
MFSSKYPNSFTRKNNIKKKSTSSAKIINPKNLKKYRSQNKYPRTSSAINLPGIHFDQNDSILSQNSTGFSFKPKNDTNKNDLNTSLSPLLNINSITDFIGKKKDPLEKQKQLYEEMKEEKMKIKNLLYTLITWDNESLRKASRKDILRINLNNNNNYNRNRISKSSKTMDDVYNKENNIELNFHKQNKFILKETEHNKKIYEGLKIMKGKVPLEILKEMSISKGTQIKEKKIRITQLKFSVFDKDFDQKKFNLLIQEEKEQKIKEENEKMNRFKEKNNLANFQKEQRRIEMNQREEISAIYKNILINKIKKKKFIEVLDGTYKLLDKARTEYSLSVDILKERIKAVQKYYNAYIIAVSKIPENKKGSFHTKNQSNNIPDTASECSKRSRFKKTGMDIYEEKIKRYREYLIIMDDLNKEIKEYDDKFGVIQDELNTILKASSDKIEQLSNESKQLKFIFNELNNQQTQYYLNILKKGNDTRSEGLSWIIKRLMELNIRIDASMFPSFLDQEQIDYIIQISKLGFECSQLKQILESLRGGQNSNSLKERHFMGYEDEELDKFEEKIKFIQFFNSDLNNIEELLKEYDDCKTFKSLKKLKNIVRVESNNKHNFKNQVLKYYFENIFMQSIIKNIKKKVNWGLNYEDSMQKNKNKNLINYLLVKDEKKEYYNDVIVLSERIKRLNDFIKKMRKEEFLIFEEKFKYQNKNNQTKKFYDKVFNALFGSSSFEFSDFQKMNLNDE